FDIKWSLCLYFFVKKIFGVIFRPHQIFYNQKLGIKYQRIRVAAPRHNGKVERQNRQDEERFYRSMKMYSLEDGRKQLAVYQKKSNNYIKTCLNFQSPNQVVEKYLGVM
ncbi:MAG: integrase core domain-containing protein, partial [Clostridia bacterium]|nr:integrase core domain-containing protein [Clostridia bacterium]